MEISNIKNEADFLMSYNVNYHIIEKLPCHIYWLNRDNVYLGCNLDQAKDFGLKSTHEIIGKTNFDFHDHCTATQLNKTNELVMSTGKPYVGEESGYDVTVKTTNTLTTKVPLFDIQGKIIGLLGISLDITDRKRAEELEKQKELYEIARKVAHDICSPLTALGIVKHLSLNKLSPNEKHMFELATKSIQDISDTLIKKYRKEEDTSDSKYIEVYLVMKSSIESKRYECQDKILKINFYPDESNKFVFINGNLSQFSRMISNLLNNAQEAIEVKEGIINVSYKVTGEEVEIRVKDNGSGIPKEIAEKITRGESVGTTKTNGSGIGMEQITSTVKELNGQMEIMSAQGQGTEFILRFKKAEAPKWFAKKTELKKGDTVVILDDDVFIHDAWKERLKEYSNDINIKYFTNCMDAINFLNTIEDKNNVFLFSDYELKNQELNGIEVIEKSGMQEKHILVTSKSVSDIKDLNNKIKIFNKLYLKNLPLVVK